VTFRRTESVVFGEFARPGFGGLTLVANVACFGIIDGQERLSVFDSPIALQSRLREDASTLDDPNAVAWWTSSRRDPTTTEAGDRLGFLREHGPSPYAFPPRQLREALSIDPVSLDDTEVQMLIAQLNADLFARYPEPGAVIFSLDPADIVEGTGALLMAVHNDRPVGCGAFRVLADRPGTAEIKRMYVTPSARGQKIGAALLAELESRARAIGVERFVLDAGPRQPEALRRFERAGYVACEPWGEFIGKDLSICMSKG
jgi:putative acetyltransferase